TVDDAAQKGLVTAVMAGQAKIRAKDPGSGSESDGDEGIITVVPGAGGGGDDDEIVDIEIRPAEVRLRPGGTATLKAFAIFGDDTEQDVTAQVVFASNDTQI